MRTEKGYRFTLQFPDTTEEQRLVGEYLEGLGSKKSSFNVMALSEYLSRPPEKPQAGITGLNKNELKDIVLEALAERGVVIQQPDNLQAAKADNAGLDTMLDHIDIFG